MDSFAFYPWQLDAYRAIAGKSAVLSAPTGSGKTLVAYLWSGILDERGLVQAPQTARTIFTAPIKALSNERYLDLRKLGLDVGIETGDFKKNEGAPIICCTQEIYTLKYSRVPGQTLVVDEFHYIFSDSERARTYIDGIRATAPEVPVLVMSATFGGPRSVQRYLSRITGRSFVLHESAERVTELVFRETPVRRFGEIRDALIFLFSRSGVTEMGDQVALSRQVLPSEKLRRLD